MIGRLNALDAFYVLLADLERRCGGTRRLADCDGRMSWPKRGVYFFFEDGEFREDGTTPRVVRVGTHALRQSRSSLWGRLSQHRGTVGGQMAGGGNHRGSVFRLHVGTALLEMGDWPDSVHTTWAIGPSADAATRIREYPLERAVSERIRSMPFVWLAIGDPPGGSSDRGVIERGAIALLSNYAKPPIDPASVDWIGDRASNDALRQSGLWNVNHVRDQPSPTFLQVLSTYVDAT